MINDKMAKALNEQINEELYSSYLYLAMSAWFESQNLPGFAAWMKVQAREEHAHALKFFEFIHECRGRVVLQAIQEPAREWKSPLAAFEAALKHEQHITGRMDKLMNLALAEKDYATAGLLQWFVKEQVEEEASADRIVQMLKMAANAPGALLMLDHQMGERK
ncbi:MAG: ferritin [Planctomycetes bacterium]|jgi:ferritin|nr:ferritin [Planctomycetota bacterium]